MTDGPAFLLPSEAKRASNGAGTTERTVPQPPDGEPAPWIAPVTYDQWRRYLLPVPGSDPGELEPWTRVTTLAKLVGSEHGLTIWTKRELMRGVGMRPSLRALLADGHDDKAVLDEVIEAATEAAGMNDARRWGTAVHTGVERAMLTGGILAPGIDLGEQYGRDVYAAVSCLHNNGARVRLVERVVVHSTLKYAGRFDYLLEVDLPATALNPARTVLRVFDVKTGARIAEQGQQVGAQLSAYVNATHLYDPATRGFSPLPSDLDTSTGYVLAVREGRAQLYEVDLLDGWIDMRLAIQQHRRGKAGTSMSPVGAPVVVVEAPMHMQADVLQAQTEAELLVQQMVEQAPALDVPAHNPAPALPAEAVEAMATLIASAPPEVVEAATPTEVERSPSGRARRACSKCRQPGHTAKRCPGVEQEIVDADGRPAVEYIAPAVTLCPHTAGWSRRESDGAWVCGDCGKPSEATVEAMRTGALLPVGAPAVADMAPLIAEARAIEEQAAPPAFVPPWQAPAFVEPTPQEQPTPPTLLEQIDTCASQEELGALWKATNAAGGEWTAEHTERAQQRISAGLPILAS